MAEAVKPVNINILGKEYLISCAEGEHEPLHNAAAYLNLKMQALKNSGNVIGTERIAVMAALNIANELLAYRRENEHYASSVDSLVKRLHSKIDNALIQGDGLGNKATPVS